MASTYSRNGIFWIKYYQDGRMVRYSLKTKDRRYAEKLRRRIEDQLDRGDPARPPQDMPAVAALEDFVESIRHRLALKTVQFYRQSIEPFLREETAPLLKHITEPALQRYINRKMDSGQFNPNTSNHIISSFKVWLNFCVRRGYLHQNPLALMKKLRIDKDPVRFLSEDEIARVLDAARTKDPEIEIMIRTALYTGMRRQELLTLEGRDVDLQSGQITVRKAKSRKFRVIPIHPDLAPELTQFRGHAGHLFDATNIRRRFRRVLKAAGFTQWEKDRTGRRREAMLIGWHTFRHTFASHCVMAGIPLATVSAYLGHSNITTTMIYAHLAPDHKHAEIARLQIRQAQK